MFIVNSSSKSIVKVDSNVPLVGYCVSTIILNGSQHAIYFSEECKDSCFLLRPDFGHIRIFYGSVILVPLAEMEIDYVPLHGRVSWIEPSKAPYFANMVVL